MGGILIAVCLLIVAPHVPAEAQETSPSSATDWSRFRGGRFLDESDSLGYDEFRVLSHDHQLERRQVAKRWARQAREAESGAGRQPIASQAEAWLEQGLDAAATSVGICPYFPEGWLLYGSFLNTLGRYQEAVLCLNEAERTLPYDPGKSRQKELKRDLAQLRSIVSYNLGDFEACLAGTEEALALDSGDEKIMLLSARALIALERYSEARGVLSGFDRNGPRYALSLSVLALLEMKAGQLDAAADAFDRAYKYGQRGAVFENDRGRLYLQMERYDDAVSAFESAIEAVPSMMEAHSNLAVAHRRAGRLDRAREVLEAALETRIDYAPAHFNLAEVLREQRSEREESGRDELTVLALQHYDQALTFGYDAATVVERRAGLALRGENLELAEEDLLRMTENPEMSGRVLHLLGRVKKEQGRFEIALNLFEMAEQRGFGEAVLFADRGEVKLRQGDLEGARDDLGRACELGPRLVATRVNLSIALSQLGDLDGAERALSEAESLAPEHALVQTQREALRRMRSQR